MKRPQITRLQKWIPAVSPRLREPKHLAKVTDLFERIARGEVLRECLSAPPRHAKTTSIEHGVAWLMKQRPGLRVIWATYGQRFSERSSKRVREIAARVGVPLDRSSRAKSNWRTGVDDGGFWCTSIGGAITGEGCDLLVVDDGVKGRADAESALEREKLYDWFTDDAFTRLDSPDASALVSGARWHQEDLVGKLVEDGWGYTRLPAVDREGHALWPERFAVAQLQGIRETLGEYGWSSLYLGEPMRKGGQLFGDVHFVGELPAAVDAVSVGVDLAYSARSSADYSVAVVMSRIGSGKDAKYYVHNVVRAQELQTAFAKRLATLKEDNPAARWRSYVAGTERGTTDLLRDLGGVDVGEQAARGDKHARAQPISAAWNAARIFLPRSAPWLDSFVSELKSFTGVRDRHDDQVDAAAAAFDELSSGGCVDYVSRLMRPGVSSQEDSAMFAYPTASFGFPRGRF